MRMAMVEVIGCLIRDIATSDEGDQESRERRLNNLYELLIERLLDLSSYVRSKTVNTLSKLCDLPVKFPKQRLIITEMTVGALEDKASSVRRYAIALLTKLILTHPYGLMHGGLLKLEEWEQRYKSVCDELVALDNQDIEGQAERQTEDESSDEDEEEDQGQASDIEDDGNRTIMTSPTKTVRSRR